MCVRVCVRGGGEETMALRYSICFLRRIYTRTYKQVDTYVLVAGNKHVHVLQ